MPPSHQSTRPCELAELFLPIATAHKGRQQGSRQHETRQRDARFTEYVLRSLMGHFGEDGLGVRRGTTVEPPRHNCPSRMHTAEVVSTGVPGTLYLESEWAKCVAKTDEPPALIFFAQSLNRPRQVCAMCFYQAGREDVIFKSSARPRGTAYHALNWELPLHSNVRL
jgi:hypothetical protein